MPFGDEETSTPTGALNSDAFLVECIADGLREWLEVTVDETAFKNEVAWELIRDLRRELELRCAKLEAFVASQGHGGGS
jgi:hypothetical protein